MTNKQPRGAGRPPDMGERKVTTSIRVTPLVMEYLRSCNSSVAIELAIRGSKAFRDWKRNQGNRK